MRIGTDATRDGEQRIGTDDRCGTARHAGTGTQHVLSRIRQVRRDHHVFVSVFADVVSVCLAAVVVGASSSVCVCIVMCSYLKYAFPRKSSPSCFASFLLLYVDDELKPLTATWTDSLGTKCVQHTH